MSIYYIELDKEMLVVFGLDISSTTNDEDIKAMTSLISNTIKTFDEKSKYVTYSIVTFHEKAEIVNRFDEDDLSGLIKKLASRDPAPGSSRNLDALFEEIDQNVLSPRRYNNKMDNAVVIVLSAGNFNPTRKQSYPSYKRLVGDRTVDVVFVSTSDETNHDEILGDSVRKYTAPDVGQLPEVLSKLSKMLGRKSGGTPKIIVTETSS